jgi:hypothetical protein
MIRQVVVWKTPVPVLVQVPPLWMWTAEIASAVLVLAAVLLEDQRTTHGYWRRYAADSTVFVVSIEA